MESIPANRAGLGSMRNMSFAMTTRQMRERSKFVTRRRGWWDVKPGELLCAVEKGQGLKKGEKVVRICVIRVVSARNKRLAAITKREVALEGFPELTPAEFVGRFCQANGCKPTARVRRIQFEFPTETGFRK